MAAVALKAAMVTALGLALASCAGVSGIKGNDTGGIIPYSPDNARAARTIAREQCAAYEKRGTVSSMRRAYGDYITYVCRFGPPRHRSVR